MQHAATRVGVLTLQTCVYTANLQKIIFYASFHFPSIDLLSIYCVLDVWQWAGHHPGSLWA